MDTSPPNLANVQMLQRASFSNNTGVSGVLRGHTYFRTASMFALKISWQLQSLIGIVSDHLGLQRSSVVLVVVLVVARMVAGSVSKIWDQERPIASASINICCSIQLNFINKSLYSLLQLQLMSESSLQLGIPSRRFNPDYLRSLQETLGSDQNSVHVANFIPRFRSRQVSLILSICCKIYRLGYSIRTWMPKRWKTSAAQGTYPRRVVPGRTCSPMLYDRASQVILPRILNTALLYLCHLQFSLYFQIKGQHPVIPFSVIKFSSTSSAVPRNLIQNTSKSYTPSTHVFLTPVNRYCTMLDVHSCPSILAFTFTVKEEILYLSAMQICLFVVSQQADMGSEAWATSNSKKRDTFVLPRKTQADCRPPRYILRFNPQAQQSEVEKVGNSYSKLASRSMSKPPPNSQRSRPSPHFLRSMSFLPSAWSVGTSEGQSVVSSTGFGQWTYSQLQMEPAAARPASSAVIQIRFIIIIITIRLSCSITGLINNYRNE